MIRFENISKSYGKQQLFDQVSFKINAKERIGLIGRNGHGKTTMMRMIINQVHPDDGQVVIPKNYRVGYVKQHIQFQSDTVLEEGMRGLPAQESDHYWKVEKVLAGLGFSQQDMSRPPSEFSGGYQVRLNLAKALVSEPDLLLLDEPTNYLDITSIRWIENFLIQWPRELLLITHDRSFMDRVVTHILAIHRKRTRKIKGNTEKLYTQIAQDEEIFEKTRLNDERKQKELEQFISRFRAKARLANLVQSRVKTLQKMEKRDKLESLKDLEFSFRYQPIQAKYVMHIDDISFSYTHQPMIEKFTLHVQQKDRICIVGPNGKGKTTLLKILAQAMDANSGTVSTHPKTIIKYYEQTNVNTLIDDRTVEEEITSAFINGERQQVRSICGAMMFEGDDALKPIRVLSGGEKARVLLGKILASPANLLLLDEPTNHLDMTACDALLTAIDHFDGAVIMVTHNEMFLNAIADRLVVFQDEYPYVFEGSYAFFLEKKGWKDETDEWISNGKQRSSSDKKQNRKNKKQQRAKLVRQRSQEINPLKKKISQIETKIVQKETELDGLNAQMQTATQSGNAHDIARLGQDIHERQQAIDQLFDLLEQETELLDNIQKRFDQILEGE
ncbi:MAG: ABC-F family ATP-binding cassette domain-containing protein [Candidatus Magnetomorum sp.]|nr:ABC-F family ATP-binding cassette domain-containing protein [Candidatus Magnetomorum sp.]